MCAVYAACARRGLCLFACWVAGARSMHKRVRGGASTTAALLLQRARADVHTLTLSLSLHSKNTLTCTTRSPRYRLGAAPLPLTPFCSCLVAVPYYVQRVRERRPLCSACAHWMLKTVRVWVWVCTSGWVWAWVWVWWFWPFVALGLRWCLPPCPSLLLSLSAAGTSSSPQSRRLRVCARRLKRA